MKINLFMMLCFAILGTRSGLLLIAGFAWPRLIVFAIDVLIVASCWRQITTEKRELEEEIDWLELENIRLENQDY